MTALQRDIINLIKSALIGEKVELSESFSVEDALKIAKKHRISILLYYGLANSQIKLPKEENYSTLELLSFKEVAVSNNQMYALSHLYSKFEENGIDYLLFKGSVLKELYPKPELRPMGDADILIKVQQYEKIKPIMEELGYDFGGEGLCEIIWKKKGQLYLELHKSLVPSNVEDYYIHFGTGWDMAIKSSGYNCRYELSPEDHFLFIFTHLARHYRSGGIGIKHFVDIWMYNRIYNNLDSDYIIRRLDEIGLKEFYHNVIDTLSVWFDGKEDTSMSDFITSIVFESGAVGLQSKYILSDALKRKAETNNSILSAKQSKIRWLLFLPYDIMCLKYPVLKKVPILLPLFWVIRGINAIIFKKNKIKNSLEEVNGIKDTEVEEYRQALDYVGLEYKSK